MLNNSEVFVLTTEYKDNRTTSPQDAYSVIKNELTERRHLLQNKYVNLLSVDIESRNGDIVLFHDWISSLIAFNQAAHRVTFVLSLITQARNKGFVVKYNEGQAVLNDVCLEAIRSVNEAEETLER